jgi:hypothetical protein
VTVLGLVRNFPVPPRYAVGFDGAELDLVQMTIKAGSKFSTGFPLSGLVLITADGQEGPENTDLVTEQMNAAGYQPLPAGGPDTGQSATGWVAFKAEQAGSPTLTLRYKRGAASVIGSSQQIPAKTFDIPLVT